MKRNLKMYNETRGLVHTTVMRTNTRYFNFLSLMLLASSVSPLFAAERNIFAEPGNPWYWYALETRPNELFEARILPDAVFLDSGCLPQVIVGVYEEDWEKHSLRVLIKGGDANPASLSVAYEYVKDGQLLASEVLKSSVDFGQNIGLELMWSEQFTEVSLKALGEERLIPVFLNTKTPFIEAKCISVGLTFQRNKVIYTDTHNQSLKSGTPQNGAP